MSSIAGLLWLMGKDIRVKADGNVKVMVYVVS
jgi:hypothetical protein